VRRSGHRGSRESHVSGSPARAHSHTHQDAKTHLHGDSDTDEYPHPDRHATADRYTPADRYADPYAIAADAYVHSRSGDRYAAAYGYPGTHQYTPAAHTQTQADEHPRAPAPAGQYTQAAVRVERLARWHILQLWRDTAHGPYAGQEWRDRRRHLVTLLDRRLGRSMGEIFLG
jgi:hypothetical protein